MKAFLLVLAAALMIGCATREEQCEKARQAWLDDRRQALSSMGDPSIQAAGAREIEVGDAAYTALCLMRSRSDLRCLTSGSRNRPG